MTDLMRTTRKRGATTEISFSPIGVIFRPHTYQHLPELAALGLKEIVIQYVNRVENLELPHLKRFTVIFGASEERPVLRNISLPSVREFKIAYHNVHPIMSGIKCPSFDFETYRRAATFEICHMASMRTPIKHLFIPSEMELDDEVMAPQDYEFAGGFHLIKIVGGPMHLAQSLLHYRLVDNNVERSAQPQIHWKKTFKEPAESKYSITNFPCLPGQISDYYFGFSFESVNIVPPPEFASCITLNIVYYTNNVEYFENFGTEKETFSGSTEERQKLKKLWELLAQRAAGACYTAIHFNAGVMGSSDLPEFLNPGCIDNWRSTLRNYSFLSLLGDQWASYTQRFRNRI